MPPASLLALLSAAALAASPCDTPERHRFDFWIGEWDVVTAGGQPAGKSSVQAVSNGCGLLENWSDLRGGSGKSLNAFNPQLGTWQQFWVGAGGAVTEYRRSEWHDGALTFHADGAAPDGTPLQLRLTFSRQPDGTVRQLGERSADDGRTWSVSYDLHYVRRATGSL